MKILNQPMPGYQVNDYLLVLKPHEELWGRILKIKKEFGETYDAPSAIWGKPHITLVSFTQFAMMEERIVQRLKATAMGYHPFKVELKDFGSYPTHTIYINVISKLPLQNLVKQIRSAQQLMKLDKEHKPHFIEDPHMTIARQLVHWQYEKGWLEYSHREFTGRFIADSMLLIKRKQGDKAYQIVQRFEFQNLPVTTKQGELFGGNAI
jgi:2'-5' RNA ligase